MLSLENSLGATVGPSAPSSRNEAQFGWPMFPLRRSQLGQRVGSLLWLSRLKMLQRNEVEGFQMLKYIETSRFCDVANVETDHLNNNEEMNPGWTSHPGMTPARTEEQIIYAVGKNPRPDLRRMQWITAADWCSFPPLGSLVWGCHEMPSDAMSLHSFSGNCITTFMVSKVIFQAAMSQQVDWYGWAWLKPPTSDNGMWFQPGVDTFVCWCLLGDADDKHGRLWFQPSSWPWRLDMSIIGLGEYSATHNDSKAIQI